MGDVTAPAGGGLRRALAFLTPIGGAMAPSPEALFWFPAVGALLGLVVGTGWWLATELWSPLVSGVIAVIVDLGLTGMLHLDGVCDAADGLLPPLDRARRLAVMATPEIGAFGVAGATIILVLRVACLAMIAPSPVLLAALWAASRTVMAAVALGVPYARPGGLASGFLPIERRARVIPIAAAGAGGALLLAMIWSPVRGPVVIVALGGGAAAVVALGWRRIGGYTGDVLGAAGVIGETAGLLAAAARW